jgi:hypothetical protein
MAQRDPEQLASNLEQLGRLRADAGRDGSFEVSLFGVRVESVDDVHRYEDLGISRVLVVPYTNPREGADALARFGDEVIARL